MEKIDFRKISFTRVPNFVFEEVNTNINSTEFMVYVFLLSRSGNNSKKCIISTSKIADELLLTRRTISNSISKLESVGLISIRNRFRRDGGRVASEYTILDKN